MKKHLSITGIGPVYVSICVLLTILGGYFTRFDFMQSGKIEKYNTVFIIFGIIFIIFGIFIGLKAVVQSKILENIKSNTLVTTGVYSWVRNPIYSAELILLTGCSLLFGNLYLLVLPIIFWALMAILLINTEEKWLKELYGDTYIKYTKRVNRSIPWFPKK